MVRTVKRTRLGASSVLAALVLLCLLAGSGGAAAEDTTRVSVDGSGTQANSDSFGSYVSADGRYVAFNSDATNLVAGDTNGASDVFVHERATTQPSDCLAPTTTHALLPSSNADGWNNSDVTVTLSAQDDEGGSGVKEIRYSATGAQSIPKTVYEEQDPPVVSAEGTTTISYSATDNAGNRESPPKTFTVRIDKTKPEASSTTPLAGTKGVAPASKVSATFSEEIRASSLRNAVTLRSTAFTLVKKKADGTTTAVAAKVRFDAAAKRAILDPDTDLVRGARYVATVTTSAKDLAGNALDQNRTLVGDQPKRWIFTVRS